MRYTIDSCNSISGLVAEYIVAIDVTRVRFPADALFPYRLLCTRFRLESKVGASMHDEKWRVVRRVVRE